MLIHRLIAFILIVVCSTTLIVSALFAHRSRRLIQEQVEKRGAILIQTVAKQALDAMRRGDFESGLEGVVRSLHHDPDVEIAIVIDGNGNILAHTEPQKIGRKMFLSAWDQKVLDSTKPMLRFDKQSNRHILAMAIQGPKAFEAQGKELAFPVGSSAFSFGAVYVGLSQRRIAKEANKTIAFIGVSTLLLLIAASIFAIVITQKIVQPLKTLGEATQEIAKGNLLTQVPVSTNDEIGQLAAQFNTMTQRLRKTTITKNQLESVVAQKTKALREVNQTLLEANAYLKQLQELESQFVSMASHELRTPLTSISGFVSLMQKYSERLSKDQTANYLNTIASEAARLNRMINEILDLKRIEQGRIELRPTIVDVVELAKKVVEELRVRPNQPNYDLATNGSMRVYIDEDKLKQVFINLLSNAAKYTPMGKTVTVEILPIGKSAVINVRDEGPGIPKELWEKLFHPFARANDEVARKTVGSGLGLAITKSLVETMGGRIRAENLTQGAQFTVVLPQGR